MSYILQRVLYFFKFLGGLFVILFFLYVVDAFYIRFIGAAPSGEAGIGDYILGFIFAVVANVAIFRISSHASRQQKLVYLSLVFLVLGLFWLVFNFLQDYVDDRGDLSEAIAQIQIEAPLAQRFIAGIPPDEHIKTLCSQPFGAYDYTQKLKLFKVSPPDGEVVDGWRIITRRDNTFKFYRFIILPPESICNRVVLPTGGKLHRSN